MYVYLWEYVVAPEHVDAFMEAYGPQGAWVRLFRESEGYLGTSLLRDRDDRARFVTIDRWASKEHQAAFMDRSGSEFRSLDETCASLTLSESLIGHFESDL